MKRSFLFLVAFTLLCGVLHAQSVKTQTKDTAKYRANDRLRTAGPKNGWKDSGTTKSTLIKPKNNTVPAIPKRDTLKRRN
jgi:hypothetical protein